jgi:hypothetical protein
VVQQKNLFLDTKHRCCTKVEKWYLQTKESQVRPQYEIVTQPRYEYYLVEWKNLAKDGHFRSSKLL